MYKQMYRDKKKRFHRLNGPAVIRHDGCQIWFFKGLMHRTGGPAYIDATKEIWYQHGKYHRVGGPAYIDDNGNKIWYQNGKVHREDGPAIIDADDTGFWYYNGNFIRRVDLNERRRTSEIRRMIKRVPVNWIKEGF